MTFWKEKEARHKRYLENGPNWGDAAEVQEYFADNISAGPQGPQDLTPPPPPPGPPPPQPQPPPPPPLAELAELDELDELDELPGPPIAPIAPGVDDGMAGIGDDDLDWGELDGDQDRVR